jgi:predicted RNA-binding Zn-ribbon protein involved in translation (DUF1610 family)
MPDVCVVRCFSCEAYQATAAKKAAKFACVVCGEKQSVRRVYAASASGREAREAVMRLNARRGALDEARSAVVAGQGRGGGSGGNDGSHDDPPHDGAHDDPYAEPREPDPPAGAEAHWRRDWGIFLQGDNDGDDDERQGAEGSGRSASPPPMHAQATAAAGRGRKKRGRAEVIAGEWLDAPPPKARGGETLTRLLRRRF